MKLLFKNTHKQCSASKTRERELERELICKSTKRRAFLEASPLDGKEAKSINPFQKTTLL